ncbi:MAG: DUF5977 domain-containing protein [Chitinophagaceae bacterium]
MKKHFFLVYLLTTYFFSVNAQSDPSLNMIGAPTSPAAASLSRYVDFPVTMSSGIPGISIPLYEFKSSRITVPISLSYHAGGVRVTDRTSTMGLGWTLIAGGAITRSVAGLPDEKSNGFFFWDYPAELSESYQGLFYQHHTSNPSLSNISCFVNGVDNSGANLGFNKDHSPDNYYYSAQGLSGQFTYNTDRVLHTMPYDPIRIKNNIISSSSNGVVPFIITGTDGVIYEFGGVFSNGKSSAADYLSSGGTSEFASAWYLTKIISADRSDTVYFHYSTTADSYMNTGVNSTMTAGFEGYTIAPGIRREAKVTKSQSSSTEYNVRLLEITGKNGKVVFNYGQETINSYRWGNTSLTFPSTIRPLSSIEVYANRGTEVKIKQFNLQHSFFNSIPVQAPNSLRLDGVTETGYSAAGSHSNPAHVFSYATNDVPTFNTNSRDLWGFYNGYTSYGDNDNMLLVDLPVPSIDENGNRLPPKENFLKRAVNPSLLNKAMLKSISYPSGGYSEFTFEPNGKSKSVMVTTPQRNTRMIRTMDFWPGSGTGGIDKTFTLASTGYNRKLEFYGRLVTSGINYLENDPQVILEDVTTSQVVLDKTLSALASSVKTSESFSIALPNLDPAHTYRLYFPMPSTQFVQGLSLRYDLDAFFTEDLPPLTTAQEQFIYAGGLRVKSIEHRDNFTSGFVKKQYNYLESYWNSDAFTGDFSTVKGAFGKQLYVAPQPSGPPGSMSGYDVIVNPRAASYIYQESPSYSIGSPSSSVSYSKVEEIQLADDDKFIGKTEYTFNTGLDMVTTGIERGINWRQHVKVDRSFIRSQLLNKKVYKSQANEWVLIQETQNAYNNINDLPFDVKGSEYVKRYVAAYLHDDAQFTQWSGVNPYPAPANIGDPLCNAYYAAIPISFNIMYLNITRPTLASTTTKELGTAGNWIQHQINYEYLNLAHMQPGSITKTKSDGSTVIKRIKYSTDVEIPYEGHGNAGGPAAPEIIPSSHPVFSGLINLQLSNITVPVETSSFIKREGEAVELLTGSTFNYYNPRLPVIDAIAGIELAAPVSQFSGANIFDDEIDYQTDDLIIDPKYRTLIDFKYNESGSLVQQHKANDIFETFLWGYKEQYPLANIKGAKYDVVKNIIATSFKENTAAYSDNNIRTELNKLRTDVSAKGALINTYTVATLTGITSETDQAGKAGYYEYDQHGRLAIVRDHFNHVVKKYEYNYNHDRQTFTYVNRSQSSPFTKNDCPSGYSGVPVTYKVAGGKYYSTISQADADQKAAAEITSSGQAFANAYGTCTVTPAPTVFVNQAISMAFEKDDCPEGMAQPEDAITYTVNAGQFSSTISQADAQQKALDDLYISGQAYANANCSCSADPVTIELKAGKNTNASLVVMNVEEDELEDLPFPVNTSATAGTIELPPSQDGYILKFVVPLAPPYTDPYSNGPYGFVLQSEGLLWRSIEYTGRSNTTIWTQTQILKLRPGRTYTIMTQ